MKNLIDLFEKDIKSEGFTNHEIVMINIIVLAAIVVVLFLGGLLS